MKALHTLFKLSFSMLILLAPIYKAFAQIPQSGIYQLKLDSDNFFDVQHYASYIRQHNDFYTVKTIPHHQLQQYGIAYALVAVDFTTKNVKIALLRDTLSKKGRASRERLKLDSRITHKQGGPYFTKEFMIQEDSLIASLGEGFSFPYRGHIDGQLFVQPESTYYQYFAIYKKPEIQREISHDSITGKTLRRATYTFEQSFFLDMDTTKKYKDLRYTFQKNGIPVYKKPKDGAKVITNFKQKEFMAVCKDSADWFAVDRVVIKDDTTSYRTPQGLYEGTTTLKVFSGWVEKEDLVGESWVRQEQEMPRFRFEVSADPNYYRDKGIVEALKIVNKKTGKQQIILDINALLHNDPKRVVELKNCNFDGYSDVMLYYANGGAGANYSYNFYLYSPKIQKFVFHKKLSNLPQVEIDSKSKTIKSSSDPGRQTQTFQWKKGKLKPISELKSN